ncbi:hypothetical protein GCM10026982_10130 [Nocardiopsis aegyptia]
MRDVVADLLARAGGESGDPVGDQAGGLEHRLFAAPEGEGAGFDVGFGVAGQVRITGRGHGSLRGGCEGSDPGGGAVVRVRSRLAG